MNIYLHCESGHYCYKCVQFKKGNSRLEREHRENSWKQILPATNGITIDDVKLLLQSGPVEWGKLSSDAQVTVKKAAKEIITLKQTAEQN